MMTEANGGIKVGLVKQLLEIAEKNEQDRRDLILGIQKRSNEMEVPKSDCGDMTKEQVESTVKGHRAAWEKARENVSCIRHLLLENSYPDDQEGVRLYSLVTLVTDEYDVKKIFILPCMGGQPVGEWLVVTPSAPIAQAIMGKKAGDEVQYTVPRGTIRGEITEVQ